MKNIFFCFCLALCILPGCNNADSGQNTPPAANPDPAAQEAAQPVKLDKDQIDRYLAKANENLSGLKALLKQIDALPAAVQQAKAEQIATFRNNLSGMIAKMQISVEDLTSIQKMAAENKLATPGSSAAGGGLDSPFMAAKRLKAYGSDLDRYGEDLKNYGDAIKDLAKGGQ